MPNLLTDRANILAKNNGELKIGKKELWQPKLDIKFLVICFKNNFFTRDTHFIHSMAVKKFTKGNLIFSVQTSNTFLESENSDHQKDFGQRRKSAA
jgi:hypothetical protein